MRFVCTIMHKTTVLARVSIDDKPGQNPMRVAEDARQTLARDANRYRSDRAAIRRAGGAVPSGSAVRTRG